MISSGIHSGISSRIPPVILTYFFSSIPSGILSMTTSEIPRDLFRGFSKIFNISIFFYRLLQDSSRDFFIDTFRNSSQNSCIESIQDSFADTPRVFFGDLKKNILRFFNDSSRNSPKDRRFLSYSFLDLSLVSSRNFFRDSFQDS